MPLIACLFVGSRPDALRAPCGTVDVVQCPECSHIYNRAFQSADITYAPGYENSLTFSSLQQDRLKEKVDHLVLRYSLQGKKIVEIGCGNADFLSLLCETGGNFGTGYDPSQADRTFAAGAGFVEVKSRTLESQGDDPADFVCALHVLEHLADLKSTLRQARALLKPGGAVYVETPNGQSIFSKPSVWDLSYEHPSYFTPGSMHRALNEAGFFVVDICSSFGDQYLHAEAIADDVSRGTMQVRDDQMNISETFPGAFRSTLNLWGDRVAIWKAEQRRVVLWGAGAKAVTFLNMLRLQVDCGFEYVVDINPRKTGRFMPRTGQEIVGPEQLRNYRPDMVVVMNPEYLTEIRGVLDEVGIVSALVAATSPTGAFPNVDR